MQKTKTRFLKQALCLAATGTMSRRRTASFCELSIVLSSSWWFDGLRIWRRNTVLKDYSQRCPQGCDEQRDLQVNWSWWIFPAVDNKMMDIAQNIIKCFLATASSTALIAPDWRECMTGFKRNSWETFSKEVEFPLQLEWQLVSGTYQTRIIQSPWKSLKPLFQMLSPPPRIM